ncbi:MAG: TRAP transporter substrate-binding protein [Burkholderiaceae bacterium]
MKMIFLAALCAATVSHAQTRWNLASGYSAESFHSENLGWFAQAVAQSSQGRLSIAVHPAGSMLKLAEIPAAVEARRVEIGETIMSNLVGQMPVTGADSIPFVVKGYSDAQRLWSLQRPLVQAAFARRGLKVLYAVPWPPQGLYARKPLSRLLDLKGSAMRSYNPATVRLAEMLGARAVPVPMAQVNAALASGSVDSMITSAVTGVENKVWTSVQHYYPINAWFPKNIVFANLAAFDSLALTEQGLLMEAARQAEERGWRLSQAQEAEATAELRRQGVQVEPLPVEFEQAFKRMGERFSIEWLRTVGNEANQIFIPYYATR